jgi:hypothetical protein
MRSIFVLAGAAVVAAGAASPASAQSAPGGGVSAGVTGGTLGIGPEVAYRFSNTLGVRANATFLGVSRDVDSDDINYNGDLKLASGGLMLDFHPFGGGFTLSAGARVNGNKVKLSAKPTADVEIDDEIYTPEEVGTLSGSIETNSLAPTLTLGWRGGRARGLSFGIEAGGMFQGSPTINNLRATGMLASDPDFQASLPEEEREVEQDIDNFKVYPILQVSLGYSF